MVENTNRHTAAKNLFPHDLNVATAFTLSPAPFLLRGPTPSAQKKCGVPYIGCCHPPLADSASCVPPVPGHPAPESMGKIKPGIAAVLPAPQPNKWIIAKALASRKGVVFENYLVAEKRDYGADEIATDLHPALSSPSATPLRSAWLATKREPRLRGGYG